MPHEFSENERDPETQTSAARGMGPPRKGIGADVLDPPGEVPVPGLFRHPRIFIWLGILLLLGSIVALVMTSLLRR
jgi:hypothetical protein